MASYRFILALILGLVLGVASTGWLMRSSDSRLPAATPATVAPEKKVLYWYDPMVPSQHFAKPGKSPFMDMQLVAKFSGDSGDSAGVVSIDARLRQNLGVRTAQARRGLLTTTVRATGIAAFDERAVSWVQARVPGIVEKLEVRTPLTAVTLGQPLLSLIAPDWTAAQAEYLSLRGSRSAGLESLRIAARQRLLLLGMSENQIRSIERSGHAQDRITINAPRGGVVAELMVRDGAGVMAGSPLMRINGLDTIWINAAIPETQVGRVSRGSAVAIEFPAFPGETITGTVESLLPDLDAATRTQTARIVAANTAHRIVPGMFARLQITPSSTSAPTVLVPSEAVIATGTRHVVIVDASEGRFRAQEVRIGDESNGQTAILEGLADDDLVVLSGQFLIDSEASLSGTLARLDGSTASADATNLMPPTHEASGIVKSIDGKTWIIATAAIASLGMDAMTMTFVSSERLSTDTIHPGQSVRFSFIRNRDGDFEIVTIAAIAPLSRVGKQP